MSVKRSAEKRWELLFAGLTTRAVFFEVVSLMDMSSCVLGIDRLVFRRGVPSVRWPVNGTNVIASEKEALQNLFVTGINGS